MIHEDDIYQVCTKYMTEYILGIFHVYTIPSKVIFLSILTLLIQAMNEHILMLKLQFFEERIILLQNNTM